MTLWPIVFLFVSFLLLGITSGLNVLAKKPRQTPTPQIDIIRRAAFEVIEASLEEEPDKWKAVSSQGKAFWLTNESAGLSLWIGQNPTDLCVVDRDDDPQHSWDKIRPPVPMQIRLYTLAIAIAMTSIHQAEAAQLEELVRNFSRRRVRD